jgi:hypothetical protein
VSGDDRSRLTRGNIALAKAVGAPRKWNSDEESFGYLMATILALSMERK